MTRKDRKYLWVLLPACMFLYSHAQSLLTLRPPGSNRSALIRTDTATAGLPPKDTLNPFIVGKVSITGNRHTKYYIIERELSFRTGDTISLANLVKSFRLARERLINTHLFNEVLIYVKGFRGYITDVEISVKERWYIFPLPYFKPVDRNLSAWAQKDYNLNRVNYGAKFTHYNFTGRNDNLTAWLITGYTRQFELYYNQPYADKSLKHGFGMGFSYAELKEVDAATVNNQQDFINSDTISYAGKYLSKQLSFSLRYFYRPRLKVRHLLALNLVDTRIDSAVTVWNPHYFNNGKREVFYPELVYDLNYIDVDYVAYPLKGIIFDGSLVRRGVNPDMNLWQLNLHFTRSWQLARKWWFGIQNADIVKLPLSQPFYNQQLIGYGDLFLRGLDRYVIDGTAGITIRNTLFREIVHFDIPFIRHSSHDHIPFRFYATAFSDYGYAYNQNFYGNSLVNRLLYTAGFGIDMVTFYDLNFRFDYSFNQLGQNGLFLHIRNDF